MSKQNNLNDFLTDIANAIRTKKGTTAKIPAQNFSSEILSIQTGSSSGGGGGTDPLNPPVEKLWGVWTMSFEDFTNIDGDAVMDALMLSGIEFRSDNTVELGMLRLPSNLTYELDGFIILISIDGGEPTEAGVFDVVEDTITMSMSGDTVVTLHRVIGDTNVDECVGNWALGQTDTQFAGISITKIEASLLGLVFVQYAIEFLAILPNSSPIKEPLGGGMSLDKQKIMLEGDSSAIVFKYDKSTGSLCVPIELMQELDPDTYGSSSDEYVPAYKSMLPEIDKDSLYGSYEWFGVFLNVEPSRVTLTGDGLNLQGSYYCQSFPCFTNYTQAGIMNIAVSDESFNVEEMQFLIGPGTLTAIDGIEMVFQKFYPLT